MIGCASGLATPGIARVFDQLKGGWPAYPDRFAFIFESASASLNTGPAFTAVGWHGGFVGAFVTVGEPCPDANTGGVLMTYGDYQTMLDAAAVKTAVTSQSEFQLQGFIVLMLAIGVVIGWWMAGRAAGRSQ